MDNPAVHNLDDVRLRAENGQLVLEVAGQTVPVDVDIDGSLSLDEIEAFTDNSIDAKGSDLENLGSLNTEQAVINGHPSQDSRELLEYVNESGESIETSFEYERGNRDEYIIIEVLRFRQIDSSDLRKLEIEIDGMSDGDYNFLQEDVTGGQGTIEGADKFTLIEQTDGGSFDSQSGLWRLFDVHSYAGLFGNGVPGVRSEGLYLRRGWSGSVSSSPTEVTVRTDGGSGDVELSMAVWQTNRRSQI